METCFKRSLLEYLMAPELDSVLVKDVVKYAGSVNASEIASELVELSLIIYVIICAILITLL